MYIGLQMYDLAHISITQNHTILTIAAHIKVANISYTHTKSTSITPRFSNALAVSIRENQ